MARQHDVLREIDLTGVLAAQLALDPIIANAIIGRKTRDRRGAMTSHRLKVSHERRINNQYNPPDRPKPTKHDQS